MQREFSDNFYGRLQDTQQGGVDVYLGRGAGKQIMEKIKQAREEVLIISPYLSADMLDDLQRCHNTGVRVKLAFSHLPRDPFRKNELLSRLIIQNRYENEQVKRQIDEKRYQNHRNIKIARIIAVISILLMCYQFYFNRSGGGFFFIIAVFALFAIRPMTKAIQKLNSTPYFNYDYQPRSYEFKFVPEGENGYEIVHAKIYVIDRREVFLGSMNYTFSGFKSNFESRVKISEPQMVDEIRYWVLNFFNNEVDFPGSSLSFLGRQIYREPR